MGENGEDVKNHIAMRCQTTPAQDICLENERERNKEGGKIIKPWLTDAKNFSFLSLSNTHEKHSQI